MSLFVTISTGVLIYFRAPQYTVTALFKDEGLSQSSKDLGVLKQMIGIQSSQDSKATVMFLSRKILEPLISQLGLQVSGAPEIFLEDFYYSGKNPLKEQLIINEDGAFLEKAQQKVKMKNLIPQGAYPVRLIPMDDVLKKVRKKLSIKPSEQDPRVLHLSFTHPHPEKATLFLNGLMDGYRDFLMHENEKLFEEQMRFLQKRKNEVMMDINHSLEGYADTLQREGTRESFLPFEEWMKHEASKQQRLADALLQADMEKQALVSSLSDIQSAQWIDSPIRPELAAFCRERQLLLNIENILREDLLPNISPKKIIRAAEEEKTPIRQIVLGLTNPGITSRDKIENIPVSAPLDDTTTKNWLLAYQEKDEGLSQKLQKYEYLLSKIGESPLFIPSLSSILPEFSLTQVVQESTSIIQRLDRTSLVSEREKSLQMQELEYKQKTILDHLRHLQYLAKLEQSQYRKNAFILKQYYFHQVEKKRRHIDHEIYEQIEKRIHRLDDKIRHIQAELKEGQDIIQKILPRKWTGEHSIQTQIQLNVQMLKAVIENVEAKNVSHLLMQVMAKPIDKALFPKKNDALYLPAILIGVFCFSFFVFILVYFGYALKNGLPIHQYSFFPEGQNYLSSQKLSSQKKEQDEEFCKMLLHLRKINAIFVRRHQEPLLALFSKLDEQGFKVLWIQVEEVVASCTLPPVDEIEKQIESSGSGYRWKIGSKSLFLPEVKKQWAHRLDYLKEKFDYIIVTLPFSPEEAKVIPWISLMEQVFWPLDIEPKEAILPIKPHHILVF